MISSNEKLASSVQTGGEVVNSTSKALVLVVDDEDAIRTSLCQVLEDEYFTTVSASDGTEGVEVAGRLKPDLIFLDIWMPGIDGVEALRQIRLVSPDSKVVVMSGHATIANALEATKRGAFDFIEKPLDLDGIICVANRALEVPDSTQPTLSSSPESADKYPKHTGFSSQGLKGKNVGQRTLRASTVLYGHCLHSGKKSGLVLEPLPANSGIYLTNMGRAQAVPAFVDMVQSTTLATTVSSGDISASTVEHLMAALHAYKISNLLIKCNGEVPILDGSSIEFCREIERIGIEEQSGEWYEICPDKVYSFSSGSGGDSSSVEKVTIEPCETLTLKYVLDYPAPVGRQEFEVEINKPEDFRDILAPARTFGFLRDIERLQKAGLAAGGRLDNFILIGNDGALNTELRFPDELVRHKVLDMLGDVFLLGRPVRAKISAFMTGHSDNVNLLRVMRDVVLS